MPRGNVFYKQDALSGAGVHMLMGATAHRYLAKGVLSIERIKTENLLRREPPLRERGASKTMQVRSGQVIHVCMQRSCALALPEPELRKNPTAMLPVIKKIF